MWSAWSFRNSVVFDEPWNGVQQGVVFFLKLVGDYGDYAKAVFGRAAGLTVPTRLGWQVPEPGKVRVNVDAAVVVGGVTGLGAVIRSDTGQLLAKDVRRVKARWKANLAEAMAARFGLLVARDLGFSE
ncbi:hypothetical protein SOVF_157990, partial [Spinacia oleracea]